MHKTEVDEKVIFLLERILFYVILYFFKFVDLCII